MAQTLYRQTFERGQPTAPLDDRSARRRTGAGTKVRFLPDPANLRRKRPLRSGARFQDGPLEGLSVRRGRNPLALRAVAARRRKPRRPAEAAFHFPGGLKDYLAADIEGQDLVADQVFTGRVEKSGRHGSVEWAIAWLACADGFVHSYCNTIPTPDGGTHEAGLRTALLARL